MAVVASRQAAVEAAIAADRAEEEVAKSEARSLSLSGAKAEAFLLDRWVERVTPFIKAMSDETRMGILALLSQNEGMQVGHLAKELKVRSSTVSQHLSMLKEVRAVIMEKKGVQTHCSLNRGVIAWRLGQISQRLRVG